MQSLVNISIDDVSPHPKSSTRVLERCHELIAIFPDIKFTLFVPTAYWRTVKREAVTSKPLQIDLFPEFCNEIRSLNKDNFEVCYHGHYHGIPGKSDNDELRNLSYDEMIVLITEMRSIVKKADLSSVFKEIIRPPAWRMSPESIVASKAAGIELLALSSDVYPDGSLDYKGEDKKFKNTVYYNVCPPFKPLSLFEKTEIVYHACEWDKNYLSKEMTKDLAEFLKNNRANYRFSFISGLI